MAMMPPGGSPTAPAPEQPAPAMDPQQAMAMLKQYGISDPQTAQKVKMALEALEAAGMLPEGPESEMGAEEEGAPPPANAKLAQMLAG